MDGWPTATAPLKKPPQAIIRVEPGQSPAAAQAEMVVAGAASNADTAKQFSKSTFGDVDLTACLTALNESIAAVRATLETLAVLKKVQDALTACGASHHL